MKTKEVLEARWKVITFALLALIGSAGNIRYLITASVPLFAALVVFRRKAY